jgi:virginiamycin B lyase
MSFPIQRVRQQEQISGTPFPRDSGRSRRSLARLQVERLESRCLLSVTINEFPVPTASSGPIDITSGPDGNLWFTENAGNKIGQFNLTTHVVTEFALPTPSSSPLGITSGLDGNLWFTEQGSNQIGVINPTTHAIHEFPVPTTGSGVSGITRGPDGGIWFTESYSNQIGLINPTSHVIAEFLVPTANSDPWGITSGPDGNLWFTERDSNQIGLIDPTTHVIAEFPISTGGRGPEGITTGPDGDLWFTESRSSRIGQINPTTHAIADFPIPTSAGFPNEITPGPDGNLWFPESTESVSEIGQINPTSHAIVDFPTPTAHSGPFGITTGPDGNLWFAEGVANQIGQIVLAPPPTAPDLALSGNASSSVTVGSEVTYTLTVTNNGTAGAVGVTLTDTLPSGATFVSATGGVTPESGVLTFTIGSLAAGASASIAVVVTSTATGILHNQAIVVGSQSDPTPGDNSITQTTIVNAGLTVTGVKRFGFHAQATTLVLTFTAQLDPRRAENRGNYQIVALDGSRRVIRVRKAEYDATARTVTLSPEHRLNLHSRFRLIVIGTGQNGVTDVAGNLLEGQRTDNPGSDFVTVVTAADLVLTTTEPAIVRTYKWILAREGLPLGQPAQIAAARRLIDR